MKIFVHGVGVLGPGIENWESCRRLFKEHRPYDDSVTPRSHALDTTRQRTPPEQRCCSLVFASGTGSRATQSA